MTAKRNVCGGVPRSLVFSLCVGMGTLSRKDMTLFKTWAIPFQNLSQNAFSGVLSDFHGK